MKKRFTDEQIISILREAEAGAMSIKALCKKHNITDQTFFRWRNKFGGLDVRDARRLKCGGATPAAGPVRVGHQDDAVVAPLVVAGPSQPGKVAKGAAVN